MSNKIKHNGVVDGVDENCVRVRILQSSACSACKVAAHCNASETKEKIIEVQVAVLKSTQSEGYAAVSALGILIPYYIGLYLLRNKLRNKLSFSLEPCC